MKKLFLCFLILGLAGIEFACSPVKFKAKTVADPYPPDDGNATWWTSGYGACSQACNGTWTQTVLCKNTKGVVVPDGYCKAEKPKPTDNCNTSGAGCTSGNPYWDYPSTFSACTPSCGAGTQSRTVVCRSSTGVVLNDNQCLAAGPKPATEQICNTTCSCTPVNKTKSGTTPSGNNKVDFLLVIDDSYSMDNDNPKLAERLSGFLTDLQTNNNLDWQMCVTTTDVKFYSGRPIQWSGLDTFLINRSTPNLSTVIPQTIHDIGSIYSNDEQGVKAAVNSIYKNVVFPCYRADAAFAAIIISDEDERSVAGNCALSSQQCFPLGYENEPSYFVTLLRATWGLNKRMTVNSIVVPDSTCRATQDTQTFTYQGNSYPSKSFVGTKYMELASLTSGTVGNICDSNYSTNLRYFKDSLMDAVSTITLECAPSSTPTVTLPSGYTWALNGSAITVTPALSPGSLYNISYQCCP